MCLCYPSLTVHTSVPSPVVPVPGVGQVGEGLQSSWGLEEVDDDMEEEDSSGVAQEEEATKMEEGTRDSREGYNIFTVFDILKKKKEGTWKMDENIFQVFGASRSFGVNNFIQGRALICR